MTGNIDSLMSSRTCEKADGFADKGRQGARIGYIRVSTRDQTAALQADAMKAAGCARIFEDSASGARSDRPGLLAALAYLREGDTLVVWRLDRLGRSLPHLIETVNSLATRGVGFASLCEAIDTSTSSGRLVFHVFGSMAEFERDLIRERVQAGLDAARSRGRMGGRPAVVTARKLEKAKSLRRQGVPMRAIAAAIGVSRTALYDALAKGEATP